MTTHLEALTIENEEEIQKLNEISIQDSPISFKKRSISLNDAENIDRNDENINSMEKNEKSIEIIDSNPKNNREISEDEVDLSSEDEKQEGKYVSEEELLVMEAIEWEISPFDLVEWKRLFERLDIFNQTKIEEDAFLTWGNTNYNEIAREKMERIWKLSDIDEDQCLSFDEFSIALFLIERVVRKRLEVPKYLPNDWLPSHKQNQYQRPLKQTEKKNTPSIYGNRSKSSSTRTSSNNSPSVRSPGHRRRESEPSNRHELSVTKNSSGGDVFYINGVPHLPADCIVSAPRPSGLKPKTEEEIQREMREIELLQQKLKKHLEQEEKEKAKREEQKAIRDKKMQESKQYWLGVINSWPAKKNNPKTKLLWWQGFPPSVRGRMWELASTNELNITPELFGIFGQHARITKEARLAQKKLEKAKLKGALVEGVKSPEITNVVALGREDTVDLIHLDLPRTFPALSIFQPDGPCHNQLKEVLEAYVCYRPDIGYVQGMSYIAAVLLLNLDTFPAFKVLANILNKPLHLTFFRMAQKEVEQYMDWFDTLLAQNLPRVHKQLKDVGINHTYLVDWIMTIYSKAMPIDMAMRVWDLYFLEGESAIFRTALGIFKFYSAKFEKAQFDEIMNTIMKLPGLDEEELFACIEKIDFTQSHMSKFVMR